MKLPKDNWIRKCTSKNRSCYKRRYHNGNGISSIFTMTINEQCHSLENIRENVHVIQRAHSNWNDDD